MEELPPLFQFRKIDNFLYQSLINKTIWFSSPKVFNDPFDCQLPFQTDNSLEEITKYLLYLNGIKIYYSSKKALANRAKELYFDNKQLKSVLRNIFFNERRFSCFVYNEKLVYRNSKMWGDYADKNKGVCLKFQFDNNISKSFELESDIKITPLQVKYEKAIPTFNYIRYKLKIKQDLTSSNQYFIGTKAEEWKDENEIRLIIENKPGKNFYSEYIGVKFKPKYLKEVILGCNSTEEDKDTIKKIIDCNLEYSHIKVHQLKKSEEFFGFVTI